MARAIRAHRERTGEVAKPGSWWKGVKGRARALIEAPGKLSTSELAERATSAFGAAVLKEKAVRDITKGYLKILGGSRTRKEALKAAKPQVGAVGRTPQELLDLVEAVKVKQLGRKTRAQYAEFAIKDELAAAKAAGRPVTTVPTAKREIHLDPFEAKPGSFYHEVGHLVQRTSKDPAIRKLLKPVVKEYAESTATGFGSLAEKHAREFSYDVLTRLGREKPGKRFAAKEFDEMIKSSLENVLKKSGWVP